MTHHYTFPCRNGWHVEKDLTHTHADGSRVWPEQIDGDDPLHYRVHWLATNAAGEQLGPFATFAEAIGAAVPRLPMGQLEIRWPRCA